jgi:hypothetical protein
MIKAESQERHPNEANVNIVTIYWTHVPLCQKCHHELVRQGYWSWFVGTLFGVATAGLLAVFAPQFIPRFDQVPVGISAVVVLAIGVLVAWGIATAGKQLVDAYLAIYSPLVSRLQFGNKQYQALFDEANRYMPVYGKKRSSLGV